MSVGRHPEAEWRRQELYNAAGYEADPAKGLDHRQEIRRRFRQAGDIQREIDDIVHVEERR